MAEKYAPLCSTETSILDLPDEVLSQIILLLTARERVPLGNSCQRLKTLVFEDPESLRYLDFSKKAHLTTMTDIQQYFDNENACRHILRIDAENVTCLEPGDLLNNSIGKAINLVEVNIHCTQFKDIWQLGSFLKPLPHVEKLSIHWPYTVENDIGLYRQILQRPFSKLTYLSVSLGSSALAMFTNSLPLCQQLKKLLIKVPLHHKIRFHGNFWNSEIRQLTNLKIVQYHGRDAILIKNDLATLLPDPGRWTDFRLCAPVDPHRFYIEKDVEVCEELLQSKRLQDFLNPAPWQPFNLGSAVNPECLLREVLRVTHEDVPDDLCCLSTFVETKPHSLKIEEAKRLLKDPRSQIPYLYLNHRLERDCDAHLLASAFPNLSELVLSAVTRNLKTPPKDPRDRRCLRKRCCPVPEGQDDSVNLDSSFKMLVENTPNLRHFTLNSITQESADWDLDALHLISAWKHLETLEIRGVPIEDGGQFLVEIGKQCKNLRKLSLHDLPYSTPCRYQDALFEMLEHCKKLRDFTIEESVVDQVELLELLAKHVNLERVDVNNRHTQVQNSISDWIESFENVLRQCEKLTTVTWTITTKSLDDGQVLESAVERMKAEFRRRDLEIRVLSLYPVGR